MPTSALPRSGICCYADRSYKLAFIDIPVLARVRALRVTEGGLVLLVGPTFGVRLRAETDQSAISVDVSDRFDAVETGMTVGAAFESGGFVIHGRYTPGFYFANHSHVAVQQFKEQNACVLSETSLLRGGR